MPVHSLDSGPAAWRGCVAARWMTQQQVPAAASEAMLVPGRGCYSYCWGGSAADLRLDNFLQKNVSGMPSALELQRLCCLQLDDK